MYQSDMYNLSMAVIFHRLYTIMWGFSMAGRASFFPRLDFFFLAKVIRRKEHVDTCWESRHKAFGVLIHTYT